MFKFTLGSFRAFSIYGRPYISKTRVCRAKWTKIGPQREVFCACRVLIIVMCSMSVWGHSVHFQFLATLYLLLTFEYSGIFVLVRLYITGILLTSKSTKQGVKACYQQLYGLWKAVIFILRFVSGTPVKVVVRKKERYPETKRSQSTAFSQDLTYWGELRCSEINDE